VMRCLTLADALTSHAFRVTFACLPQQGDMICYINHRGYSVTKLTPVFSPLVPLHDSDYLAWLQRNVEEDALDFIRQVDAADIVITDHYAIGFVWHLTIRKALSCKIVAIDDLVRRHNADYIIDQTLGRSPKEYSDKHIALAGTNYALLAPSFLQHRSLAIAKAHPSKIPKILIFMGGVDAPNATLKVLRSLVGKVKASYTVVMGPRSVHYHQVASWCAENDDVAHLDFAEDFAGLMVRHDIAIGAPGSTSWERACLGLPSIVIPIAANQKTIAKQLVKYRAAISLTLNDIEKKTVDASRTLLANWKEYHRANLELCDGRGAQRVVLSIMQQSAELKVYDFELTLACIADSKTVYDWQCHPDTRRYALDPSIPSWGAHLEWMKNKLASKDDYFYILKNRINEGAVGVIRLDWTSEDNYVISVFMAPDQYGKGLASTALSLVDCIHPAVTLRATVLTGNTKSQILFEKAGYKRLAQDTFVREPIN
jgi:UDP-2,4-diacetamido-2,4,6-trideoxy-beta-L-altropyranose hydrolase